LNLMNSNAVLISKVNSAIKSHSKKDMDGLSQVLEGYFETALSELFQVFNEKTKKINQELVDGFEQECKAPVEAISFEMNSKEDILKKAKEKIEDKSYDTSKRLNEIGQKIQVLDKVEEEIK